MKNNLITLLLLLPLLGFGQIIKRDKQYYAYAGAVISGTSLLTAKLFKIPKNQAKLYTMISVVAIGGAKELVYDKWMGKGTPEMQDFLYTSVVGILTTYTLTIDLKSKKQK